MRPPYSPRKPRPRLAEREYSSISPSNTDISMFSPEE